MTTTNERTEELLADANYMRASTARVDKDVYMSRVRQLRESVLSRSGTSMEAASNFNATGGICEFDLSKNVLEYLPNPVITSTAHKIGGKSIAETKDDAESQSRDTLLGNSKFLGLQSDRNLTSDEAVGGGGIEGLDMDPQFKSMFEPTEMRLLALVSHNNMKHSMKQFVIANKNVLKKFRLTGTNTTMTMLREVFGDDPEVVYGPSCKSGPLGGDAQLVAMAVTGQLGGCIFFIDPMDAHPHSADIECLVRQGNVHNILMMNNPTTAHICLNSLRIALKMGRMEMFPSFFFDLESPSVEAYKMRQAQVLQSAIHRSDIDKKVMITEPTQRTESARTHQVKESMERANRMSLEFRQTSADKSVRFQCDSYEDLDVFLPSARPKEEDEISSKYSGKETKVTKKKKKFAFFRRSKILCME